LARTLPNHGRRVKPLPDCLVDRMIDALSKRFVLRIPSWPAFAGRNAVHGT
jgi:hypothetical protein